MDTARFIASFAWRDLRASGRYLWVFWACLMLGVTLIAASGGLFKQVSQGLLADSRALFGGDLEVEHRSPLSDDVLSWMRQRGEVSLLIELRTMMLAGGRPQGAAAGRRKLTALGRGRARAGDAGSRGGS
jgi:putative ABC transport system permease protein